MIRTRPFIRGHLMFAVTVLTRTAPEATGHAAATDVCADLADYPLETQIESAPPIVMLLLDDSGSMAWDVVCPENGGEFSGNSSYNYVEDAWKSQWAGYNGIYYNPDVTYEPWAGGKLSATQTWTTRGPIPLDPTGIISIIMAAPIAWIPHLNGLTEYRVRISHYYVWSSDEDAPYLVNLYKSGGTITQIIIR